MSPYSNPTKRVNSDIGSRPKAITYPSYFLAGAISHLFVVASIFIPTSSTSLLPTLWFLIGAFLPLAVFIFCRTISTTSFIAYIFGMAIAELARQQLMWGHIMVSAFKGAAFLLPAIAGLIAFVTIMLARRNA